MKALKNGDKHQKLEDEDPQNSSQRESKLETNSKKINRDEIIEKLSKGMKKFNEDRK